MTENLQAERITDDKGWTSIICPSCNIAMDVSTEANLARCGTCRKAFNLEDGKFTDVVFDEQWSEVSEDAEPPEDMTDLQKAIWHSERAIEHMEKEIYFRQGAIKLMKKEIEELKALRELEASETKTPAEWIQ